LCTVVCIERPSDSKMPSATCVVRERQFLCYDTAMSRVIGKERVQSSDDERTSWGMSSDLAAAAAPKPCRQTSILENPSFSSLNALNLEQQHTETANTEQHLQSSAALSTRRVRVQSLFRVGSGFRSFARI